MDLISIVIPVYNTGKYLTGCLDSCLKQTHSNFEIIVIDDCSTDPLTKETLQRYENKDPRLQIYYLPENRGQGYCRNKGLEYVKGKYFTYLDSDDTFVENALERMYEEMLKYQTDFVMCDVQNFDRDDVLTTLYGDPIDRIYDMCRDLFYFKGEREGIYKLEDIVKACRIFSVPALCYAKLFNTENYRNAGILFNDGPFSRHCQDEDWSTLVTLKLKNFAFFKFICIERFIHLDSASSPSVDYYRCSLTACQRRFNLLSDDNLPAFYLKSVFQFATERLKKLFERAESEEYRTQGSFALKIFDELNFSFLCPNHIEINRESSDITSLVKIRSQAFPETPKLMYFSLQSLLDISDQNATAIRNLLEHLSAKRFNITTFSAQLYAKPRGNMLYEKLFLHNQQALHITERKERGSHLMRFEHNGISYVDLSLSIKLLDQLQMIENSDVIQLLQSLNKFVLADKPDVILFSGNDALSLRALSILKSLNVPIFYVPTANKAAPSLELKQLASSSMSYAPSEQDKVRVCGYVPHPTWLHRIFDLSVLNSHAKETFNEKSLQEHAKGVVCLANPSIDNGLALMIGLINSYAKRNAQLEFAIFNDPANSLPVQLQKLHDKEGRNLSQLKPNLSKLKIRQFAFSTDELYKDMKVLLTAPCSPDEAFNAIEAAWQGVKVLTTDKQASVINEYLPESKQPQMCLGLALPECMQKDPTCIPDEQELAPWIEALDQLCATPHQALSHSEQTSYIHDSLDKWDQALCEVLEDKQKTATQYFYRID